MNGVAFKTQSRVPIIPNRSLDSDIFEWQDDADLDQEDSYYVPSTPFTQKLNGLDPSLYLDSGEDYCTEENFDQTSTYVNHQLGIYGFPTNLKFLRADKQSAARIVTALHKILQQHLKDTEYKQEMDLNWRRLSNDYDTMIQNLSTTKAQLEKAERESDALSGRISALEDELRAEGEKHRHTREELKSARANLQYTKTQYAHEARKKEQEMNVLKDKLQKSINRTHGSSSTVPGGIKILNPVQRSLYGKNTNEAEQLLKEVIEQQQAKEAEVVEENEQLRRTLYTVHVELEKLIKKNSPLKSSPNTPYGLPFEMVKDRIETEIRDTLTLLSDQWDHRPSLEPTISPTELAVRDQRIGELQKEVEKMQLELEDSTLLVQGAQKMIDNLTSGGFIDGLDDFKLNVEGSDMTLQEINEAEAKIRQQREELARERKKFTESCIDLGRQREDLAKAKAEFEESKRTFSVEEVLSFLSYSPRSEKRTMDAMDCSPPISPKQVNGQQSKKRVATSPLPLNKLDGRASKLRTKTPVQDVSDVSSLIHELDDSFLSDQGREDSMQQIDEEVEEIAVEEEEEEEEELLSRTTSRQRGNFSSSQRLAELSRSNYDTSRESLDLGDMLPSANVSKAAKTSSNTSFGRTSFMSMFEDPRPSTPSRSTTTTTKNQPFSFANGVSSSANSSSVNPESSFSKPRESTPPTNVNKRLSASFSPTRPSSITSSTSPQEFFASLSQRSSPNRALNPRLSGSFGTLLSSSNSVPLLNAAKVPSALSKAAANLAARKSTARYPASSTSTTTTKNTSSSDGLSMFSTTRPTRPTTKTAGAVGSKTGTSSNGSSKFQPSSVISSRSSLFSSNKSFERK